MICEISSLIDKQLRSHLTHSPLVTLTYPIGIGLYNHDHHFSHIIFHSRSSHWSHSAAFGGYWQGLWHRFSSIQPICIWALNCFRSWEIYATSALKEAWSQLNLDKVTDHQVPEIVKVWARRKPQEGEVIRAQVKSAISKAKETLESFKGSSISDGRLRDGLSDLVNKFCFDALSDCNNTATATNYVSHFFFLY